MYSKELEKIAEKIKQSRETMGEITVEHFEQVFGKIEREVIDINKNYIKKFKRRVLEDYSGNDDKIESIYRDITNIENNFFNMINKLQSNVK